MAAQKAAQKPAPNQPISSYMLKVPLFCICNNLKYYALVSAFSLNTVLNALQALSCYNPIHRQDFLKSLRNTRITAEYKIRAYPLLVRGYYIYMSQTCVS